MWGDFRDTLQIIHHFPPRTMPHKLSPRCASRLPLHHRHQRATQYVRAMALSIPSAPAPNAIIHNKKRAGFTGKRDEYPMAATVGSSVGFVVITSSLARFPFIQSFPPILV